MNKKKLAIGVIVVIIFVVIGAFFSKNNYKKLNFGKNINNKSINEMESYILNISSYDAKIDVTVTNNKGTNKYILNQKQSNENEFSQEVIEPSNIKGVQTIFQDGKLEIRNSKLNLSKTFENYPSIIENVLWLSSFIKDYKEISNESTIEEENNEVIMNVKVKNSNRIIYNKSLYIDKNTGNPTKLFIKDENNKTSFYIVYNEIELNSFK